VPKLCIYQFCGFIFLLILLTHPGHCAPIAEGADKFLGNITNGNPPSDFSDYWNQLTLENSGKWGNVERNRNQMDWSSISAAYNYAKSKNFPYKQHTFVWGTQEPGWIGGLSASEQKKEVEEWIRAYGENFPETEFIDVVNEPLNKPHPLKMHLGAQVQADGLVVWSFETNNQT
jgi:endo-1,4-beta-xylanase